MAIELQQLATTGETGYIAKHNSNYAAIQGAVNGLETAKLDAAKVGQADGVAGLDGDGKVPTTQLPIDPDAYQVRAERGQANGYPELGADGKVPSAQLPTSLLAAPPESVDLTPYQLKVEKGQPNGYAGLDGNGDVPAAQLPDLSGTYQAASAKGQANGYPELGADGKVPSAQLPDFAAQLFLAQAFIGGRPADAAVLLAIVPTVTATFAEAFASSRAKAGVAATANTVLVIKKNGVQVGTITFAAGSAAGVFAAAAQTVVGNTDELTVEAPAVADATLADIRFTLHGTR